jgi:hypothetical protein
MINGVERKLFTQNYDKWYREETVHKIMISGIERKLFIQNHNI